MSLVTIKKTPARSAIAEFLGSSNSPVDAMQITNYLRGKNLNTNKVTVYRIMEFMLRNGIVNRLEFGEGKFRFELKKSDHHHLICQDCSSITDIPDNHMEKFEEEIKGKTGFLVKSHSLEFFGICKDCLAHKN